MPTCMHGDSISMIYVSESQHGHAKELICVQIFLVNLGEFGAKRVGRAPPPPLVPRLLQAIRHELQSTIATQTCQQESSTAKEMMTGIPQRLCGYTSPFVSTLRLPHERHLPVSYHTRVAFSPHNCVIQDEGVFSEKKSPKLS